MKEAYREVPIHREFTKSFADGRIEIGFNQLSITMETNNLLLLSQAGKKTGFLVRVNATEGQSYPKINGQSGVDRWMGKSSTGIVGKGQSNVIITNPSKDEGFSEFWNAYEKLKKEQELKIKKLSLSELARRIPGKRKMNTVL